MPSPSGSLSRSRSWSRDDLPRSRSRSRRSRSYRSRSRSRSQSISRRRSPPRRNGRDRNSRSRTRSRSRSRSYDRDDDRMRSLSRGRSRSRSESPLRSTKIVVERLTKNVTEDHLREIFGQYGDIDDMDVPLSRQYGTNRGAAYILYVNETDAESAIAHMHEAQLDGATISVSIVLPRRKFSAPPPTATRGANFDPRLPPPGRGPRGPRGPPGFDGGPRGRGPRGGGRYGRGAPPSDTWRPRSISRSRSRSRSPAASTRGGRYRARSPSYSRSRSRSSPPSRRGRGRRYEDDYNRRRSPSRESYESYGGHRAGRSRSRDRRSHR
ncbi:RNA-binding domain-containing protein [Cryphonectria parasitica EP155]|uniref:RNA-binding domain-containing protein n=1 Tax=Cryphonectria parasitica (strain ATCC 38755 / EP155) TaxID=660469 RepID=A0A9P4Y9F9_CRYP1|nr:RNA-binding domain-containing protein [Cryphonectria parasitica EP155]KAF3768854.1 RNA-binding domain-containing protein [Cryphonectria parasitica EP155]